MLSLITTLREVPPPPIFATVAVRSELSPPVVAKNESSTEALAVAWADAFAEDDESEIELPLELIAAVETGLDDESLDESSEQDSSDEEMDDWMLAAFDLEETLTQ